MTLLTVVQGINDLYYRKRTMKPCGILKKKKNFSTVCVYLDVKII